MDKQIQKTSLTQRSYTKDTWYCHRFHALHLVTYRLILSRPSLTCMCFHRSKIPWPEIRPIIWWRLPVWKGRERSLETWNNPHYFPIFLLGAPPSPYFIFSQNSSPNFCSTISSSARLIIPCYESKNHQQITRGTTTRSVSGLHRQIIMERIFFAHHYPTQSPANPARSGLVDAPKTHSGSLVQSRLSTIRKTEIHSTLPLTECHIFNLRYSTFFFHGLRLHCDTIWNTLYWSMEPQ